MERCSRYDALYRDIENPVKGLFARHDPDFIDTEDTLIIIDEIKEGIH